jgi:hydroxymethylglutaryl-CoA reductase
LIGINFLVIAASIVFPHSILSPIVTSTGFAIINRGALMIGNGSMMYQMEAVILVIGVINLIRAIQASTHKSR